MIMTLILEKHAEWCLIAGLVGAGITFVRLVVSSVMRRKAEYWLEWIIRVVGSLIITTGLLNSVPLLEKLSLQDGLLMGVIISVLGLVMVCLALMQFMSPRSIKAVFA